MSERLLPVHGAGAEVAVGSSERDEQTCHPLRPQTVSFPDLEYRAEARPLAGVENDRRVISGHLERLADPFAPGDEAELLEQCVPVAPGDVDDLSRYIDVHPVEPAPFHEGQAYSAAPVSERLLTARELAAPVASLVGLVARSVPPPLG